LAAASELLRGKALYRDIWFDKPPLYALFYLLCSAAGGWGLRLLGSAFVLAACACAYWFGRRTWGEREGVTAALLLGVYLTFGIPSAVMAIAPDLLMIVPHIAAVGYAATARPVASGIWAGAAFLCHTKGLFVLLICSVWSWRSVVFVLAGFTLPVIVAAGILGSLGALPSYWTQVWVWGAAYSRDTFVARPALEGALRTVNWLGFHSAAALGAVVFLWRERSWRFRMWIAISGLAVCAGLRFFPRYYFQLLVPVVLAGARGITLLPGRSRLIVIALLLIPAARFGPRYAMLAEDLLHREPHEWADLALMEDSREAAQVLRRIAGEGDTLLVWGYRPDIFVFSGLPAGTRFLDSQPLTGVFADRHLVNSRASLVEEAAVNREALMKTRPTIIVDGLGLLNPNLAITSYGDLRRWFSAYREVGRTRFCVIYRLVAGPDGIAL
jgi:hypothetical protein